MPARHNRKVTITVEVDRQYHNGSTTKADAKLTIVNGGVLIGETDFPDNVKAQKELRAVVKEAAPFMEWLYQAMGGSEEI